MLLRTSIIMACRFSFMTFPTDFSEGVGLSVDPGPCKPSGRFAIFDLGVVLRWLLFCSPPEGLFLPLSSWHPRFVDPTERAKTMLWHKFRWEGSLARAHNSPRSWHFGWLPGSCLSGCCKRRAKLILKCAFVGP